MDVVVGASARAVPSVNKARKVAPLNGNVPAIKEVDIVQFSDKQLSMPFAQLALSLLNAYVGALLHPEKSGEVSTESRLELGDLTELSALISHGNVRVRTLLTLISVGPTGVSSEEMGDVVRGFISFLEKHSSQPLKDIVSALVQECSAPHPADGSDPVLRELTSFGAPQLIEKPSCQLVVFANAIILAAKEVKSLINSGSSAH